MTKIPVRENLFLRSLTAEDAPAIFAAMDRSRVYLRQWLPFVDNTTSVERPMESIEKWRIEEEKGTDIVMGIFLDGAYAGNIGLHDLRRDNKSGMIGYWLDENRQGRGIMTDSVQALTDYAFRELSLNRLYICCAAGNAKSRAIPTRLGYLQEGVLRDGIFLYGTYHDEIVYGMLARDWTPLCTRGGAARGTHTPLR